MTASGRVPALATVSESAPAMGLASAQRRSVQSHPNLAASAAAASAPATGMGTAAFYPRAPCRRPPQAFPRTGSP